MNGIQRTTHLAGAILLSLSLPLMAGGKSKAASSPPVASESIAGDVLRTTAEGTQFMVPGGWSLRSEGTARFVSPPEDGARIALVDVRGGDADAAVLVAWRRFDPAPRWPLELVSDIPARDGWERIRHYTYETSANDQLLVTARAYFRDGVWTVLVGEVPWAIADKRRSQLGMLTDRILPRDQARESFAGNNANKLTPDRVEALRNFVTQAQEKLGIPGVAMGLIQDGEVVYAGGQGVRAIGQPGPVNADTRFLVASNTKGMTTLLLARLVDQGMLAWDTPVHDLWPSFALGDPETTRRVQVKHLVCACTGLPRQDYEWLMQYDGVAPSDVMARLAGMQPTSEFGALYQYSNPLAAAGGYLAGHVLHPELELGEAYDRAMREQVFEPLGMRSTTFDFNEALSGNHAQPHARNVDGKLERVDMAINRSIVPVRPAGGAWSTVNDMLRFVQMELRRGLLPDGSRHVSEHTLLARREPQVKLGADAGYGMGLVIERRWDVHTVAHGGSMIGYQTGMLWLPEHDTGIVLLTNADNGSALMPLMRRYLLEVLFDGRPLAQADLDATATRLLSTQNLERDRLELPAAADVRAGLADRYRNGALGDLVIRSDRGATIADFGEWSSELASRRNDDGSVSLVTVAPGLIGFELVVAGSGGTRQLIMRDNQHEYVFDALRSDSDSRESGN